MMFYIVMVEICAVNANPNRLRFLLKRQMELNMLLSLGVKYACIFLSKLVKFHQEQLGNLSYKLFKIWFLPCAKLLFQLIFNFMLTGQLSEFLCLANGAHLYPMDTFFVISLYLFSGLSVF